MTNLFISVKVAELPRFGEFGFLDEILNLIESVSEDFPSYSHSVILLFVRYDVHLSLWILIRSLPGVSLLFQFSSRTCIKVNNISSAVSNPKMILEIFCSEPTFA